MFLYEKTHRYLKNDYQFFDTWKTKYRRIRGNCNFNRIQVSWIRVKFSFKQRDLALFSKSQYVYHSRIHAFSSEYSSRKRIKEKTDSSEWLFHPKVFQAISQLLGSLKISLFTSCLWHQLPQYIAWHPDPYNLGTGCNDTKLEYGSSVCISLFQYGFKSATKN